MHTFVKKVTFTPLSRGRYRCNQTGVILSQKQIITYVSALLSGKTDIRIGIGAGGAPPRKSGKKSASNHASKYRAKQQ